VSARVTFCRFIPHDPPCIQTPFVLAAIEGRKDPNHMTMVHSFDVAIGDGSQNVS
jgi:hypothetical protein